MATELFNRANPPDDPRTQAIVEAVPVKRVGTPEDVAHPAGFFLDERPAPSPGRCSMSAEA